MADRSELERLEHARFAIAFDSLDGGASCLMLHEGLTWEAVVGGTEKVAIFCNSNIGYDGWREHYVGRRHYQTASPEQLDGLTDREQLAARILSVDGEPWRAGTLKEAVLLPGQYHPRVWRGWFRRGYVLAGSPELDPAGTYGETFHGSIVAAGSLFAAVEQVFRVVEPNTANLDAYGHRLRELLILLCTEVEAAWRGVLLANDSQASGRRLSTRDYCRLDGPLRLGEWAVALRNYPLMPAIVPFRGWDETRPTQSLPWYAAYNCVKHDREGGFDVASLRHVLGAAAALHVMQVSQWGPGVYDRWHGGRESIFHTALVPTFDVSELHFRPIPEGLGVELEAGPVRLWR